MADAQKGDFCRNIDVKNIEKIVEIAEKSSENIPFLNFNYRVFRTTSQDLKPVLGLIRGISWQYLYLT